MKKIVIIACTLLLQACASSYHPVSRENIVSSPPEVNKVNGVKVTIKRNASFIGGGLDGRFYYDDKHIVTLARGETYSFLASAGQHKLGVKSFQPIFLAPIPFYRETNVIFEKGKNYIYLIDSIPSAGLKLLETNE
ncbi:hypothetical protein [Zooshikella harenae]|uniref:Lipoprotein n=1 Tax=Zooshikella harenae TaxID=2827238 RepID=A0ABS5Z7I0_9GAMM|nr:hypothetical protein [Zooshikella harenae]MBU2710004.1 hypothetical protein [Zooshikella harenae]